MTVVKKYTTVLFDLDNTLIDFSKDEHNALVKTLEAFSIPPTPETVERYVKINDALWKQFEKGTITTTQIRTERFRKLLEEADIQTSSSVKEISDKYAENLADGGILFDGSYELCEKLVKDGCKIYAVTNGIETVQINRLKKSGLDKLLSGIFISESIGFQKPLKEYFDFVFSHINEDNKERIILVGDSLTSDIAGAVGAGIDCIWLNLKSIENTTAIRPTYEIHNIKEAYKIISEQASLKSKIQLSY